MCISMRSVALALALFVAPCMSSPNQAPVPFSIEGRVLSEHPGTRLQVVQVSLAGTTIGALADSLGRFRLQGRLESGTYLLHIVSIGYQRIEVEVTIEDQREIDIGDLTLVSANIPLQRVCTPDIRPGIEVEVRDSVTDALVPNTVVAIAQEGSFVDTLAVGYSSTYEGTLIVGGADERVGTYLVRVTGPGYRPWERREVVVDREDPCHVKTTYVIARMQRN